MSFLRANLMGSIAILACGWLARASDSPLAASADRAASPVHWRVDYRDALAEARASKSVVVIWFVNIRRAEENENLERGLMSRCLGEMPPSRCIPLKLSIDAKLAASVGIQGPRVLDHPAFAEMLSCPGIALIDMRDETSEHFHHVVSVYPFVHAPISELQLKTMLELPAGSLTQRTLIWAVRTFGDNAASAGGEASSLLMSEAASHSRNQAAICRQGHHGWNERFRLIHEKLPPGLVPQEVCAESWPGQTLVEAAQECVHSWRQSDGHWDAVRTRHPFFGYDMQRGANGIWYATGIFARQR